MFFKNNSYYSVPSHALDWFKSFFKTFIKFFCYTYALTFTTVAFSYADQIKIGFGSCLAYYDPKIWEVASSLDLDAFIILGDSIYLDEGDINDINKIKRRYLDIYDHKEFLNFKALVPVYAQWDDHDFGLDNSDSSFNFKKLSTQAFKEFWNNRQYGEVIKGSIAGIEKIKDLSLIFTDNRSFRVNADKNKNPVIFGEKQVNWIIDILRNPEAKFILLLSGTQFLSENVKHETISQYPKEKKLLLSAIQESPAKVLILSGDRHFAEVLVDNSGSRPVFELSSSPISAALTANKKIAPENKRVKIYNSSTNFGVLTIKDDLAWNFQVYNNLKKIVLTFSHQELEAP